jgi:hypothetical protein
MLLAIDPGETSGWAVFDAGRLEACGIGDVPTPTPKTAAEVEVCIERPMIYPHGKSENPNDLITLAVNAGEHGGRLRHAGCRAARYIRPFEWKGNTPKHISHQRIWAKLNDAERSLVDVAGKGMAPGKRHNMLDAIGIGLFVLGR